MFNSSKGQISCPFHFFFSEPQRWKSLEGRSGANDEQDTLLLGNKKKYYLSVCGETATSITPST